MLEIGSLISINGNLYIKYTSNDFFDLNKKSKITIDKIKADEIDFFLERKELEKLCEKYSCSAILKKDNKKISVNVGDYISFKSPANYCCGVVYTEYLDKQLGVIGDDCWNNVFYYDKENHELISHISNSDLIKIIYLKEDNKNMVNYIIQQVCHKLFGLVSYIKEIIVLEDNLDNIFKILNNNKDFILKLNSINSLLEIIKESYVFKDKSLLEKVSREDLKIRDKLVQLKLDLEELIKNIKDIKHKDLVLVKKYTNYIEKEIQNLRNIRL